MRITVRMSGPLDGGAGLRCCTMLGLVIRDGRTVAGAPGWAGGKGSMEWVHWTVRRGAEAARWVWVCSGTSAEMRWRRWRMYRVVARKSAVRAAGAPIIWSHG